MSRVPLKYPWGFWDTLAYPEGTVTMKKASWKARLSACKERKTLPEILVTGGCLPKAFKGLPILLGLFKKSGWRRLAYI